MTLVTSHVHGTPSWIDLASPDLEASKAFYAELFGWTFDVQDTGNDAMPYILCRKGEAAAAGMMPLSPEMAAGGMPPVWTTYIAVDDLDATAAKVGPAGGQVMQPPMDVMDAGRMAVCADATGAVFALWQAKDHIGAEVVNEHGALSWNELMTPDPARAAQFYADVVGWTSMHPDFAPDYTVFLTDGGNPDGIAGAMTPPMEGLPAYWGVYFTVDDTDKTVEVATAAGATVLAPPMDIPPGRIAALLDPQGAAFSVMQPAAG